LWCRGRRGGVRERRIRRNGILVRGRRTDVVVIVCNHLPNKKEVTERERERKERERGKRRERRHSKRDGEREREKAICIRKEKKETEKQKEKSWPEDPYSRLRPDGSGAACESRRAASPSSSVLKRETV
jgi:hypothetical protein